MDFSEFNEDDAIDENFIWGGQDATIFLVDAKSTIEKDASEITKCINCIYSILCEKIKNNDNGLNAVIIYNTKTTRNAFDFPHIFNLQNLDLSCAERILELEDLLDMNKFKNKIGSEIGSSLHDVFWVCRNIFNSHKKKIASKTILLFTTNDDPHYSDDHKIRQAFKGAKDLSEAYIQLEVLPLSVSFNENKFYKELLAEWAEGGVVKTMAKLSNPDDILKELLERVTRLEQKQRTTAKAFFTLAPGSELAVKVFTYIRKQYLPPRINLYKVANEEVIRQKKETLEDGQLLMPSDLIKYQQFGNKKIKFTLEELRHVLITYESGIKLIGFKPLSFFKPFHYAKPANLLYPDEASIKGSTKIFACLHERCLLKKVCPVVQIQTRENSAAAWAFLLPQKEEDDYNHQINPPVFFVCYLPFSDDYRNVEVEARVAADEFQVDAAKNIMKMYNSKFNTDNYENPAIKTHWSVIETYALNRELVEGIKDSTEPNKCEIEEKVGGLINAFKSIVFSHDYNPRAIIRKRPAENAPSSSKRAKASADSTSVEDLAKAKKVDKLNMDALKLWLHSKGIKTSGKKKQQLIHDVYEELDMEC